MGRIKPQTDIFSKGYDPQRSEGAAVPPVFRTSTFIFKTAAEGKRAFEIAYGLDTIKAGESPALIYTRVNNPNSEILEDKITAWDGAEAAALFSSGMGAISSTCLAFLKPGRHPGVLRPGLRRHRVPVPPPAAPPSTSAPSRSPPEAPGRRWSALMAGDPTVKVIYIESPANPTNVLSDIPAARELADKYSTRGPEDPGDRRQHLHGPHLQQAPAARRRHPGLLGHQVLRRPLRRGGRRRHGQQGPDGPGQGHAHHPGLQLRSGLRLAHPPLPGHPADPHGEAAGEHPAHRRVPAHPAQGQCVAYPGSPSMGARQMELWKQPVHRHRQRDLVLRQGRRDARPSRCWTPSSTSRWR